MAINQYAKEGNGPNAHKKGNRTKSGRNPQNAININKQFGEEVAAYKEAAEKIRRAKKYKQEDLATIYKRIMDYIADKREQDKPITVSGMILASGISRATWYEMLAGDYDYRLYQYIDTHNIDEMQKLDVDGIEAVINSDGEVVLLICYSEILQKAMLMLEEQTEERLYKSGRVGDIFSLKAIHGWREEQSPQTVNQTLVIATEEQAREAIKLLK